MPAYKKRTTWTAKVLTDLREERGYSQAEVSAIIGITRSTYSYYELGKTEPAMATLANLSKLYHVPVSVFFDMRGE